MASDPGPFDHVLTTDGFRAPFYTLRFDAAGRSTSPLTQEHLVDALRSNIFTDVYLFSHGWNNDWNAALANYRAFIAAYQSLVRDKGLELGRDQRPLLVGIFWPAAAMELPWEHGPDIAGAGDDIGERDVALEAAFATEVAPADRAEFYRLVEPPAVDEIAGRRLLDLLGAVYAGGDADLPKDDRRRPDDVLAAWAMLESALTGRPDLPDSPDDFGVAAGERAGAPDAAGLLSKLDPRNLFRMLTVYRMKDRAGAVGADGVGPVLREMLEATTAATRFHLVGHSYGARVLLNAVSRPTGAPLPRQVDSLLLLQPAVNHLCFSAARPEGGYRAAAELVRHPIMTTYSVHDFPLRTVFHLALRRGKDLGDIGIAGDEPPNEYAALGGYGPRGELSFAEVTIKDPGDPYDLTAAEVLAVDGSRTIGGHSDISGPSTAWMLFSLVKG
ncbi:hypothetical protein [Nocardia bovistercoris]|uniref:Serine-threonine protein kinase n=1 Tax=Nocardia bovistercoris TaxID=2785916 RepID=A0A931I8Z8_9NOCA|nr:hypothetical protein [Nocardia bovistercoris]MBH0776296.1 hypothetical protein [Nocardia bovistercoris]